MILGILDYILCAISELIFMVFCYITNPIVVLFCDEEGNLPELFSMWQTYDNCLDVDWMIDEEIVPKIFRYDFHKHYIYHLEEKGDGYMRAGYVEIIDPDFTFKEKVQRYFCRLRWLYRNCGYGAAYYLFGTVYQYKDGDVVCDIKEGNYTKFYLKQKGVFCFYLEKPWCSKFYLRMYVGWKLKGNVGYVNSNRAMIATHINPFRNLK